MADHMATINVRLNREQKERGDAGLAEVGLSPTMVVRALWQRAAERGESLQALKDILFPQESTPVSLADPVQQGWSLADGFAQTVGYETCGQGTRESWDALYEAAMDEHYATRGLYA